MGRAKRDTYPYVLQEGRTIVYIGIMNESKRREQEHRNEGKQFTCMSIELPGSEATA